MKKKKPSQAVSILNGTSKTKKQIDTVGPAGPGGRKHLARTIPYKYKRPVQKQPRKIRSCARNGNLIQFVQVKMSNRAQPVVN